MINLKITECAGFVTTVVPLVSNASSNLRENLTGQFMDKMYQCVVQGNNDALMS